MNCHFQTYFQATPFNYLFSHHCPNGICRRFKNIHLKNKTAWGVSLIWAVLKRSFISQGRKELLTPPLTHRLRGHSASLRVKIPILCLRASLRWLTHLRVLLTHTFLWPPPFLPHEGEFIAWLILSWCDDRDALDLDDLSSSHPGRGRWRI